MCGYLFQVQASAAEVKVAFLVLINLFLVKSTIFSWVS